jgi:hypothetical protein
MVSQNVWPSFVAGVASGVVTAILLTVGYMFQKRILRSTKQDVNITPPQFLSNSNFWLGVLRARNDDGQIVNRVYRLKPTRHGVFKRTRDGSWQATIRYPRHLRFQYKCFIGCPWKPTSDAAMANKVKANRVIAELTAAGFLKASVGEGQSNRVFFIIPDTPTALDPARSNDDASTNNRFWPE